MKSNGSRKPGFPKLPAEAGRAGIVMFVHLCYLQLCNGVAVLLVVE